MYCHRMSTTIDVFPAASHLPLVEQTRARTQELFQELLDRHGASSTIEVKAFYSARDDDEDVLYVEKDVVWAPDMHLGFAYWINGEWDSSSLPSCYPVEEEDRITQKNLVEPFESKPEHLGMWDIVEELEDLLAPERLTRVLAQTHYWSEYRNMGGPAVASTGYGLVAAALAEATDGVIASFDSAFDSEHNGEDAQEFLAWWGDRQIDFCGVERFRRTRR